ncbi:MAG: AAA family ATPase, partial [bacterium]
VFQKGFHSINRNFSEHFKELFGGGDAGLELKRSGEDYGVEIIVRLPGKRAQNISSLSGGEKALASVALLAGILASNPSPFVVLDEVDAALDDINTKKFADVLKTITKHSQVLVVTHNHETMAVANELMGVTTSGTNDSQIIRVKLDSLPAGAKSK